MAQAMAVEVIMPDQVTTALRQPLIQLTRLREPYPALVLRLLPQDNVHQVTTGCRQTRDKPAGAWLTEEHIQAVAGADITEEM